MKFGTPNVNRGVSRSLGVLAVVAALVVAGCQTTGAGQGGHRGLKGPDQGSGARAVEEARRSIEAGDTTQVIPRLLHVISNYPSSTPAIEARYWLGVAYMKISSYRDAIELFYEYIKLAPEGRYAKEAQQQADALQKEYSEKYQTPEEMDAEVKALLAKVTASPADAALQMELANLLWKRGDYDSAAKIYYQVLKAHPEYADDPGLKDHIERMPNGELIVLTPTEVQRREAERQPLQVINMASFKSGKDLLTRESLYYAVTGQVVNRGTSVLYGVQVNVTIFAFGNMVQDTTTVNIGRLNPGEIRAFSVRFSNFENIDDIHRYECVASFER